MSCARYRTTESTRPTLATVSLADGNAAFPGAAACGWWLPAPKGAARRLAALALALGLVLAMPSVLVAGVYSDTITDPAGLGASLLSYWRFEDASSSSGSTAADWTGERDGTYTGTASLVGGVPLPGIGGGTAAGFDASGGDKITAPDTGLPTGTSPKTFTAWIMTTQDPEASVYPTIFVYGNTASAQNFSVILAPSAPLPSNPGRIFFSQHGANLQGTSRVDDGDWHFVAVTYDSTDYRIYVDGSLENTGSLTTNTTLTGSSVSMGFAYHQYVGALDEVAMFNKALSDTEIRGLYDAALGVPEPASLALLGTAGLGLLLYAWRKRK